AARLRGELRQRLLDGGDVGPQLGHVGIEVFARRLRRVGDARTSSLERTADVAPERFNPSQGGLRGVTRRILRPGGIRRPRGLEAHLDSAILVFWVVAFSTLPVSPGR